MNISFYFQRVDKTAAEQLKNYLDEKKLSRLTRLLQHGNLELADLIIRAEHFQRHNAFSVKLDLKIAKHELASEEKSHNLLKAFDSALDRLITQLRKLESLKHK